MSRQRAAVAAVALAAWAAAWPAARAQAPATAPGHTVPVQASLGLETLRLPANKRLGLVSGQLLFHLGGPWWLGPVTHGAATGARGGLSAGGGSGAGAPVGDGLMLRARRTWCAVGGRCRRA